MTFQLTSLSDAQYLQGGVSKRHDDPCSIANGVEDCSVAGEAPAELRLVLGDYHPAPRGEPAPTRAPGPQPPVWI